MSGGYQLDKWSVQTYCTFEIDRYFFYVAKIHSKNIDTTSSCCYCVGELFAHFNGDNAQGQEQGALSGHQVMLQVGISYGYQTQEHFIDVSANSQRPIVVHFSRCHHLMLHHNAPPRVAVIPKVPKGSPTLFFTYSLCFYFCFSLK